MSTAVLESMNEDGSARHRVLVADARLLFAETLARALRHDHGIDVVPEHPARGEAALDAVRRIRPHVVIYDNWMLELDGPSAVSAMGTHVPGAKVVVTSGYHGPHHISAALAAGAAGFLPKSLRVGQVADAVRRAAAGEALVFAEELADLMDDLKERLEVSRIRTVGLSSLTARELEVLEAVVSRRPDIVVYDLHLHGMEPSAAVRALSCWAPGTRVVCCPGTTGAGR